MTALSFSYIIMTLMIKSLVSHHGLLISFLNGVTSNLTVTIVLWWLPLKCHIETPRIENLKSLWGPREIYRWEISFQSLTVTFYYQDLIDCC